MKAQSTALERLQKGLAGGAAESLAKTFHKKRSDDDDNVGKIQQQFAKDFVAATGQLPPRFALPSSTTDEAELAVEDVEEAIRKLRKFSSTQLEKDLFVFERAFPTRGGYHSHINCIPVDRGLGPKIRTTMMSMAAAADRGCTIDIRELQNPEINVTSLLKNAEDDGLSGYFYCEVPFGENGDFKRFLYTATDEGEQNGGYVGGGSSRKHIPLQFGREILASVMGDNNLAHWKGCVLSREIEEEYTESFRKSFDSYSN